MPSPEDDRPSSRPETNSQDNGSPKRDPLQRLLDRPRIAAIGALLLALLLGAAVFVLQELFMALWFLLLLFIVHLVLRFVRAFERIAGAMEELAEGRD